MPTFPIDLNLWLRIAIVAIYVGAIVLTAELLHRYTDTNPEYVRKVVHIGTGNVIILAWLLQLPTWVGAISGVLAAIITLISYRLPILPGVNSVERKSLGTFFYAVSIGIVTIVFPTIVYGCLPNLWPIIAAKPSPQAIIKIPITP